MFALMPRSRARSKTSKAVAKRFKVTAGGKVLCRAPGRRHLLGSKNAKRKRHLGKVQQVSAADVGRVMKNLPFG